MIDTRVVVIDLYKSSPRISRLSAASSEPGPDYILFSRPGRVETSSVFLFGVYGGFFATEKKKIKRIDFEIDRFLPVSRRKHALALKPDAIVTSSRCPGRWPPQIVVKNRHFFRTHQTTVFSSAPKINSNCFFFFTNLKADVRHYYDNDRVRYEKLLIVKKKKTFDLTEKPIVLGIRMFTVSRRNDFSYNRRTVGYLRAGRPNETSRT